MGEGRVGRRQGSKGKGTSQAAGGSRVRVWWAECGVADCKWEQEPPQAGTPCCHLQPAPHALAGCRWIQRYRGWGKQGVVKQGGTWRGTGGPGGCNETPTPLLKKKVSQGAAGWLQPPKGSNTSRQPFNDMAAHQRCAKLWQLIRFRGDSARSRCDS